MSCIYEETDTINLRVNCDMFEYYSLCFVLISNKFNLQLWIVHDIFNHDVKPHIQDFFFFFFLNWREMKDTEILLSKVCQCPSQLRLRKYAFGHGPSQTMQPRVGTRCPRKFKFQPQGSTNLFLFFFNFYLPKSKNHLPNFSAVS